MSSKDKPKSMYRLHAEHLEKLEQRISRLEKLVVFAIITNLPQLLDIFF